ncbi:LysR family transcriptional regulator [Microvirga sp. ACRRW]|uniref:LysR family transcriptional regulator n=1 Tax=Microvirga sp. ACRRW TaxID=2918205 RepID=UPI001EF446D2|nr:LysR family transcriptional regulator [Microvirga sp. ACRRW]MCG7392353.1 LysR family transcriptional regulator [Microvirga sp. ACRRW]
MAHASHDPFRLALTEPSWDDLRIFLAVVAHGSMNSAAKALGQSQPTIARRIKALEETVGLDLFQRGPNNLELTEAGQAILEAASPMGEAAGIVSRTAAAYRPDPDAPVRITATSSVAMFLTLHSAELHKAAEPVEISYIPTRKRLDLASGEADIALRMRTLPEGTDDLVARKVGQIAFAIYATTDEPEAVIAPPEDPTLSKQAAYVAEFAQGRTIAARIGDMPIRYQAAKSGLGAAFLPCWLGDSDPDLKQIVKPEGELIEDIFLVMHRRSRNRPNVTRVANALAALLKRSHKTLVGA